MIYAALLLYVIVALSAALAFVVVRGSQYTDSRKLFWSAIGHGLSWPLLLILWAIIVGIVGVKLK